MGKATKKKTRWRSFSFNSTSGSKDQIEDSKNLENSTILSAAIPNNTSATTNAKYSQILSNNNTATTNLINHNNNTKNYNTSTNNNNTNTNSYNHYNTKKHYNKENYNYYNGINKKFPTNHKNSSYYNNHYKSNELSSTPSSIRGTTRDKPFKSEVSSNSNANKTNLSSSLKTESTTTSTTTNIDTTASLTTNQESEDQKNETKSTTVLFNEDEYTRITTPRQDVLFKKGYLSRMKSKTATNSTENSNNLNNNNSDPDSSTISTLSPATTPSIMECSGNGTYPVSPDMMDYPGIYYPGYYDENGVLIVNPAVYANGYNYYNGPNTPSATASSPVYLMPYPYYSYDYYMPQSSASPNANDEDPSNASNNVNSEDTNTDKSTSNHNNTNINNSSSSNNIKSTTEDDNKNANNSSNNTFNSDNGTCTPISSSEDGVCSSNQGEENKEDQSNNPSDNVSNVSGHSSTPITKPTFSMYHPNGDINGYMYPPPSAFNGFYNGGFYYYDARMSGPPQQPHNRPIKMKRRKRFMNSRNSNSQHSTENTTDYSDEEPTFAPSSYHKRFNYNKRYNNGYHPNHHNNHHYNHNYSHHRPSNRRYDGRHPNHHYEPRDHTHQQTSVNVETHSVDVNNLVMNTNLKVDVQEFYPRNSNSMENGHHHQSENLVAVSEKQEINEKESVKATSSTIKKTVGNAVEKLAEQGQKQYKVNATTTIPPTTINKKSASRDTSIKSSSQLSNPPNPIPTLTPNVVKHTRASKKEIFESLKSMEQQNIDLMANNKMQQQLLHQQKQQQQQEVEWNVIKSSKGKRIKFMNKHVNGHTHDKKMEMEHDEIDSGNAKVNEPSPIEEEKEKPREETILEEESGNSCASHSPASKESPVITNKSSKKAKKPKNKKNKKPAMTGKFEGFEIIEPEFGKSDDVSSSIEIAQDSDYELDQNQDEIESEIIEEISSDLSSAPDAVQNNYDDNIKVQNNEIITKQEMIEPVVLPETNCETNVEISLVEELLQKTRIVPDDDESEIIDINDNDIRCSVIAADPQPQIVVVEEIVRRQSAPKLVESERSFNTESKVELEESKNIVAEVKIEIVPKEEKIAEKIEVLDNSAEFNVKKDLIENKKPVEKSDPVEIPPKQTTKQSTSPPKEDIRGSPKKQDSKDLLSNSKNSPKENHLKTKEPKDSKVSSKENKDPVKEKPFNQKEKRNSLKEKKDLKEKTPEAILENHPLLDKENFKKENIAELEREVAENLKMLDTDIEIKSPIIMKNLITDFPITNAIKQWLNEKQNESFDKLFHVPNDPKIHNKIYNMCSVKSSDLKKHHLTNGHIENGDLVDLNGEAADEDEDSDEEDDDDKLDGESDISDDKVTNHPVVTINDSGVDSDYMSDIQQQQAGPSSSSTSPTSNNIMESSNSKINNTKNSSKDKSNNAKLIMVKDKLCLLM